MCTAVSFRPKDHYFGRNLDLELSLGEQVIVTPRNYVFDFRCVPPIRQHYAMIGVGILRKNYPLYYDGVNEKGLAMAGLNFPGYARYRPPRERMDNIAPFELIPWILGECADVHEAVGKMRYLNLVKIPFDAELTLAPLHWMISDQERSVVVEPLKEGLRIYENPANVLTNNPPFEYHLLHLAQFMGLSAEKPVNRFSKKIPLKPYSLGMGAAGLPGDLSSPSRFVRAAFTCANAVSGEDEEENVSQFFHILGSVEQQAGCARAGDNRWERTVYASCCNTRAASITIPRTITAGSQRWICSRSLWQAGNCRSIRCAPGRIFSAKIVGKVDNTLFRSRLYIEKVISNFYSRSVCFLMCGGNEKGALRCTLEFATMKLRNCSL